MNTDDLDRKEKEKRGSREVEAEKQESRGPESWSSVSSGSQAREHRCKRRVAGLLKFQGV